MWNGPSLWERRARNEELVILEKETTRQLQCEKIKRERQGKQRQQKVTAGRG
jgi:hypothetical protein